MSVIEEYRATQQALKKLQDRLADMSSSQRFQREQELVEKFDTLIQETGFTLIEALRILNPDSVSLQPVKPAAKRSSRKVSIYKNPFSGEIVETRSANHRVVKAWKLQYGADKVKSWLVS
ncbi:histone-like nucleoid-structuring protein, MvaT/MvaU family [Stutzerimonas stutzeri]|uniref:histone-like nucleoid-structuring protein, MvaT/MvaU family n=1 Tax=Stutzerimonas stutzeri TaxID=316 RepID=UPI0015E2E725|nr:histone-like nucleoid-structuring protein, MvaT/MvaU family [Stutzerimonas stutzeri]MBA1280421.1 DNA binding protein [Stutzerimonas stutzeri]